MVLPPWKAFTVSVPPVAVNVLPVPPMKIMWSPAVALITALLTFSTGAASSDAMLIPLDDEPSDAPLLPELLVVVALPPEPTLLTPIVSFTSTPA